MQRRLLLIVLAGAVAGAGACGGTGKSATGVTPAPTSAPRSPPTTPVTNVSGKLTVTGGAQGARASATMHTTPGASCSIVYYHPSGKKSTEPGLEPKTAAPDGTVTWIWRIAPKTVPQGRGTVVVTCGSETGSAAITITP